MERGKNVQFAESKGIRKLNVTAKLCAEREAVINKWISTVKERPSTLH